MKKISRKELATMSSRQVLAAAREPYRRLIGYLRPYRSRFALGIFFGLLAGATNGGLVFVTRHVGNEVLSQRSQSANATAPGGLNLPPIPEWVPFVPAKYRKKDLASDAPDASDASDQSDASEASDSSDPSDTTNDPAAEWFHAARGLSPAEGAAELAHAPASAALSESAPSNQTPLRKVLWICGLIPALMLVRGLFGYLNAYCMQWVSLRTLDDIRQEVFSKVLGQSQEFFNKQKVGDLIQTIFNQTRMAQMALTQVASDVVKQPVAILGALTAMLFIDWKFTLFSFTIFPLCILPVLYIGKKIRRESNKEEEEAGQLMNIMQEALGGIRVVKAHGREEHEVKRFARANQKMLALMMRWRKAMELTGPLVEATASLGIAAALVYAFWKGMGPGDFLALNGALILMYEPAKALGKLHILLQKCLAATTKIFELMDRVPGVLDAPSAVNLRKARGHVQFHGVTFSYDKKKGTAVHDIDLVIPAGSTCALVGQTGSGKSTLLALLMRFYDPDKGYITIDGHDLRRITQRSLRDHIALVNQDIFLFHDSIYENIRYGRLGATQEEIEAAARRAHAHDFIMAHKDGYQRDVGDRGGNLSGGQRQRISIARAFLRNAPILLLDEATSALDSETEAQIQTDLDELAKNRTVIAIAHRLSTILRAHQIVVLEHGRITDIGTHAELLQRSERYQRVYRMQFESALEPETAG
ncbi:MAG: ABC transporter ATP-binding protein [Verrucomicrobiales bacterium]